MNPFCRGITPPQSECHIVSFSYDEARLYAFKLVPSQQYLKWADYISFISSLSFAKEDILCDFRFDFLYVKPLPQGIHSKRKAVAPLGSKFFPLSLESFSEERETFCITKTCLYNFDPLKPHFYIVKLEFTGVYIIFLISAQNIDCGYS